MVGDGGWRRCLCSVVVIVGGSDIENDGFSDAGGGSGVVNSGRLLR